MLSEVALKSREILPKIAKVAAQLFVTRGRAQTRIYPNLYASYENNDDTLIIIIFNVLFAAFLCSQRP